MSSLIILALSCFFAWLAVGFAQTEKAFVFYAVLAICMFFLFIGSLKKRRYKKEVKNFARQAYKDMKASGYSESEARLRSAQAASDYHNVNVHNARQGLKDVPEDFMPKQKRQWISINQWLGRK